jgi:hypothetical protein
MKYGFWMVAGAVIGFITPSMIGKEWWKFWLGMLSLLIIAIAEHLT